MTTSASAVEIDPCETSGGERSTPLIVFEILLKITVAGLGGLIGVVAGFVIGIATGLIPFSC